MVAPLNTQQIPPVPSAMDLHEGQQKVVSQPWQQWFNQIRDKVNVITASIVALAGNSTAGFLSSDGAGGINSRTLTAGSGITITNGNGVAGNPTISASASGGAPINVINNSATNYTVQSTDLPSSSSSAGWVASNVGVANYIKLDTNANQPIPIGAHLYVSEEGGGTTSIAALTGVTFIGPAITGVAKGVGEAVKIGIDTWHIFGQLAYTSGGDIYYSSVVSLNHFDGTSGSTTLSDQIPAVTWAATSPTALSNTQIKFGTTSLYINGGRAVATGVPNLGTGNFTIELWAYAASTNPRGLFDTYFSSSSAGLALGYDGSSVFQLYHNGVVSSTAAGLLVTNSWVFYTVVRNGTSLVLYINGVSALTVTDSSNFGGFSNFVLGAYFSSTFAWKGYIDELRVTKGIARYTANFTPPVAPFPNF